MCNVHSAQCKHLKEKQRPREEPKQKRKYLWIDAIDTDLFKMLNDDNLKEHNQ